MAKKSAVEMSRVSDPIELFNKWFDQAQRSGIFQPETMALATSDPKGRMSVRFVLLKGAGPDGMVFYTNALSRKGVEMAANPHAAIAFWWDRIGKQVRAEGSITPVSAAEADHYWRSRPRGSQLASSASAQSEPLAARKSLVARMKRLARTFRGKEIPRPPQWVGYRLIPEQIEFWTMRAHRLHERELFLRNGKGWKRKLLQP